MLTEEVKEVEEVVGVEVDVVVVAAVEVVAQTSLDPILDGTEPILVFTVGHTGRATILENSVPIIIPVIKPVLHSKTV